jgi:hypothetical protein
MSGRDAWKFQLVSHAARLYAEHLLITAEAPEEWQAGLEQRRKAG